MEEKSVFATGQYDFTAAHFVDQATLYLYDIVRPDAGQHALPSDLHAQTAEVSQNIRSQSNEFCGPDGGRNARLIVYLRQVRYPKSNPL